MGTSDNDKTVAIKIMNEDIAVSEKKL